jgi:hypothetical protein
MIKYIKRNTNNPDLLTNTDIVDATEFTKSLSVISVISFLIGLVVFAYGYSIVDGRLGTSLPKTFTVSRSLGYGNKPGVILFTTIAFGYLFYLIYERGPVKLLKWRFFLLTVSFGLLISLLWLTPWFNEKLHYALASIIFSFILLYIIMTYYLMYKKYGVNKHIFIFLIILNILATICLLVFAIGHEVIDNDIFASFELVFAFLFGVSIIMLGFY